MRKSHRTNFFSALLWRSQVPAEVARSAGGPSSGLGSSGLGWRLDETCCDQSQILGHRRRVSPGNSYCRNEGIDERVSIETRGCSPILYFFNIHFGKLSDFPMKYRGRCYHWAHLGFFFAFFVPGMVKLQASSGAWVSFQGDMQSSITGT